MTQPDPHQPMREAIASWRQHIINGGHDSPGEYPPIVEASASFRAESGDTAPQPAQPLHNRARNPRQMAESLPSVGSGRQRANVRGLRNRRRHLAKPYGTAMDALQAHLPEQAQAVRAYVSALHDELGAARIKVRDLRAQVEGDRDE